MPTPVSMETWALIGQWIIYGASIVGAITAISAFIKKVRSKTSVARLEEKVSEHDTYLENDNKRLNAIETKMREDEEEINDLHEICQLNLKATQALLQSNLQDGNNRTGMEKASEEIQEYLNKKV